MQVLIWLSLAPTMHTGRFALKAALAAPIALSLVTKTLALTLNPSLR